VNVLKPVPGGLTADEVARRALRSAPSVRGKLAELDAALAKTDQAVGRLLPRLTGRASYVRLSPVASNLGGGFVIRSIDNNYSLSANLTVPISDYVLNVQHVAGGAAAGKAAAEQAVRAEKLKVQADARELYYNWLRSSGQVAIAQASLETTRARLKEADAAASLGAITKADLMRLQALEANTELFVKDAQTQHATLEQQLAIVMNDRKGGPYGIGENLDRRPAQLLGGSLPALLERAFSRRLELRALGHTVEALRHGADLVRSGRYPRLEAFGDVTYANPNQRYFPPSQNWNTTWSVGVSATWTVGDALVQNASASELDANARSVEAQQEAARDGIRLEVTATYQRRERALVAMETSRRALDAAEEAYRVAADLYRVGKSTTAELIDAESDLLSARLGDIDARIGLRLAENRLRHAVGEDTGGEKLN
jgi:outer membrane protein TolC